MGCQLWVDTWTVSCIKQSFVRALFLYSSMHMYYTLFFRRAVTVLINAVYFYYLNVIAIFTLHSTNRTYALTESEDKNTLFNFHEVVRQFPFGKGNWGAQIMIIEYFGSTEEQEGRNACSKMATIGYKKFSEEISNSVSI